MNKLEIAKKAAEFVVSIGVGAVVANTIKISTPPDAKLLQKISVGIGGFVLSNMVGDLAAKYTTQNIDEGIAEYRKTHEAVNIVIQENQTPEPDTE